VSWDLTDPDQEEIQSQRQRRFVVPRNFQCSGDAMEFDQSLKGLLRKATGATDCTTFITFSKGNHSFAPNKADPPNRDRFQDVGDFPIQVGGRAMRQPGVV
jgi:hypothetical protein